MKDQDWQDEYEKTISDYAECKIQKDEFIFNMNKLGVEHCDLDIAYEFACEARYEYKMDNQFRN
jgi:hypothetical protein